MSKFDIDGAVQILSDKHTVEYEPGAMTGAGTLYLRTRNGNKNVPIFINQIDDVIEMLKMGKNRS